MIDEWVKIMKCFVIIVDHWRASKAFKELLLEAEKWGHAREIQSLDLPTLQPNQDPVAAAGSSWSHGGTSETLLLRRLS